MEVRRIGLRNFGLKNIPIGTPLSELEGQLVPLYLHHRYQLVAAAKSLGGVYFTYAVRTPAGANPVDGRARSSRPTASVRRWPPCSRRLSVDELRIPKAHPRAAAADRRGLRRRHRGVLQRTHRCDVRPDQRRDDRGRRCPRRAACRPSARPASSSTSLTTRASPGFDDVVAALIQATWTAPRPTDGYGRLLQEAVQTLDHDAADGSGRQ